MTLGELQTALLEQAEESGTGFMTVADATALINRSLRDLARKTHYRVAAYTLAVTSAQVYDLTLTASRFLSLRGVYNGSSWLTSTFLSNVRRGHAQWYNTTGIPQYFFFRGAWKVVLYPRLPASGTANYSIIVSETPVDLSLTTDAVTDLPERLQYLLADGAMMLHYLDEKEASKYTLFQRKWEDTVAQTRSWAEERLSVARTMVAGGDLCLSLP